MDATEALSLMDEVRPSCIPCSLWFIDRDCCKDMLLANLMAAMTFSDEGPNVTEMNNIPLSEIEHSVHAILNHSPPVIEPSISAPPPPPSVPSATKPWQRSSLPCPTTFTPWSKPIGEWIRKALDIITKIEEESLKIEATLVLPDDFACRNTVQVAQIWVLLEVAAMHVNSVGHSLRIKSKKCLITKRRYLSY